jgi:S1-C subfamily serine protease
MKECPVCHQQLSEDVSVCPICGEKAKAARSEFEGFQILEFLGEIGGIGFYRARDKKSAVDLLLRIYQPQGALTSDQIQRFQELLEAVNQIDSAYLVRSTPLRQAATGEWYRTSEWVEVISWGDLISSRLFTDPHQQKEAFRLFRQLALALHELHTHGLLNPELTHDDLLLYRGGHGDIAVKLDYKYSQFVQNLSPVDHLSDEKVKSSHPDFLANRPLDARSDIWSLGYFIIGLLTGNKDVQDPAAAAGPLEIPPKLKILLQQMVDPNPDLRPSSLATVADRLLAITDQDLAQAAKDYSKRRVAPFSRFALPLALLFLVVLGGGIWLTLYYPKNETALMMEYANRYNRSMAFVAVEYGLKSATKEYYQAAASGTAFLVDSQGYLLSNRHVVCPWTEDQSFFQALREIVGRKEQPVFSCRHLLWFEGEKAFKKAAVLGDSTQLQDRLYVENAYRSDGQPAVRVAGVLPEPQGLGQRIRSPLGDDAAVLKIDRVPMGLEPLPLADPKALEKIGNLAPVMVLGFPLSIEAQEDNRVKSNATMGHVRRNYPAVIQVNASIHSGNSGGPVIGLDGKVIGIATAVKITRGLLVSSGLSDFGLIFPVDRALLLLESIRAGKAAWDGVIDPSLPAKLMSMENAARQGKWQEALAAVEAGIKQRKDPSLLFLAGHLYLAQQDWTRARTAFQDLASIVGEGALPRFSLYLCDWLAKSPRASDEQQLVQRNWLAPGEFYGFLTRLLAGRVTVEEALSDYEDRNEKTKLHYVAALVKERQGDLPAAEQLLREGLMSSGSEDINTLLLQIQLKRVQAQRAALFRDAIQKQSYLAGCQQFHEQLQSAIRQQTALAKQTGALWQTSSEVEDSEISDGALLTAALKQKLQLYANLAQLDTENRYIHLLLGFVHAELGDWQEAEKRLDTYLARGGREQGNRLAAGLMRAQMRAASGDVVLGTEALRTYALHTADPWYRDVARCLLGEIPAEQLARLSEENPPLKLTFRTAMGIQMEQRGEKEKAIQHYSEALESYLDDWLEFAFARARIVLLRGAK